MSNYCSVSASVDGSQDINVPKAESKGTHSITIRDGEIVENTHVGVQRVNQTPGSMVDGGGDILATAHNSAGMPIKGPVNDKTLVNWEGGETSVGALIHLGILTRDAAGIVRQAPERSVEQGQEQQAPALDPPLSPEEKAAFEAQFDYQAKAGDSLTQKLTHDVLNHSPELGQTLEAVAEAAGKTTGEVLADIDRIADVYTAEALNFISEQLPEYDPQDVLDYIQNDKHLQNHVITLHLNGRLDGYKDAIKAYRQLPDAD